MVWIKFGHFNECLDVNDEDWKSFGHVAYGTMAKQKPQ